MGTSGTPLRTVILGASGYTGAELLRLLSGHAGYEITALTADRHAGETVAAIFPHLGGLDLPALTRVEEVDFSRVDAVFCGLPHGTTQEIIAALPADLKIVDLSADFRLDDVAVYADWYGAPHKAPTLQKEAVYGLTEIRRDDIRAARLIANPGCYPTMALLPLVPLIAAGAISAEDIIIDAKSGATGAGRALREGMLFSEVAEGIHAYGVAHHRHMPEIDQALTRARGRPVITAFTPHLMPMNRGALATIYVRLSAGVTADDLRAALDTRYAEDAFIRVLPAGAFPATRHVRGSNHCLIGVGADRLPGRAILVSVIDNLVKGASGQAIQNMNLMCGLPEESGLTQAPFFP